MPMCDWSSDVCSSDLLAFFLLPGSDHSLNSHSAGHCRFKDEIHLNLILSSQGCSYASNCERVCVSPEGTREKDLSRRLPLSPQEKEVGSISSPTYTVSGSLLVRQVAVLLRHSSQVVQWQRIHLQCRRHKNCVNPWVGKISWGREWKPTSVFLSGQSH